MPIRDAVSEPILVIANKLESLPSIEAVDMGCGIGRHDIFLYRYFGDRLKLTCLDAEADQLKNISTYFSRHGVKNFQAKNSSGKSIPFSDDSLDCMFAFNTLHRYNLPVFLGESARALKTGGYLFIYTRLFEGGKRGTTGRQSPGFGEKTPPLYTMETLKQSLDTLDSFSVESIAFFAYNEFASLEQLIFRPKSHEGSNFSLYSAEELEEALKVFSIKIQVENRGKRQALRFDENVLFIIKKEHKTSLDYLKIATGYRPSGTVI